MKQESKGCQAKRLENSFKLTRVGVTGVVKPVLVHRDGRDIHLTATMDIFVDLPSTQRGSHMSRSIEVVTEMIEDSIRTKVASLEDLAAKICKELLDRHEYASFAEVRMSSDYFLERRHDGGKTSLEQFRLMAKATAMRGNGLMKQIGVQVVGMTACPCAQETVRGLVYSEKPELEKLDGSIPVASHNQRNRTTLMVEVPEEVELEADDLIEIVEGSISSPSYGILKRDDEAAVVLAAHRNPKFVEDVVRDILAKMLERYPDLDDNVHVEVRSESEESIHKHNAFAERVTTLGELRR